MASISFLHLASAGKKVSTEKILENIRKHHFDYYFLGSDCADDLSDIAQKFTCHYQYYEDKLGYPSYNLEKEVIKNIKKAVNPSKIKPNNDYYSYINERWIKKINLELLRQ